jgi:hypothetical protein
MALKQNLGYVGEDVDLSNGLPSNWTSRKGFYGTHDGVTVQVYPGGLEDRLLVSSMPQAEVRLSEVINLLQARVKAKDRQGNDILLMTCGLPDERGYVCPADTCMFQFVLENAQKISFAPHYLKSIVLHLWNTSEWIEIFRADTYMGWPPQRS